MTKINIKSNSFRLLLILIVAVCFVASGFFWMNSKAQILHPKDSGSFEKSFSNLISAAREKGAVRVVIALKFDFKTEENLTLEQIAEQRDLIKQLEDNFIESVRDRSVLNIKRFDHFPVIKATVNEAALNFLKTRDDIAVIREDKFEDVPSEMGAVSDYERTFGNLASLVDAGVIEAKTGQVKGKSQRVPATQKPPKKPPVREEPDENHEEKSVEYRYENSPGERAVPTSPQTVSPQTQAPIISPDQLDSANIAPDDMVYFRQHDMTSTEAPVNFRSTTGEPTTVTNGTGVFYTANWFAARSVDGGQNFTYVNPYTTFPSANGGFCCDQTTAYAPTQDMFIWGLQYIENSAGNTFRIARTNGTAGLNSGLWTYWSFTAQNFGFAAGYWMDYPSMTVSAGHLYITLNVFPPGGQFAAGSVIWRIPLSELAAGGTVNYTYITYTNRYSLRLSEGTGSTMHWTALNTGGAQPIVSLYHWADGSNTTTFQDTIVNAFNPINRDGIASSPDGTNWAGFVDSRILAAYLSSGVIGSMWSAKQGGSFPYPYTIHARFSESTGALITQQQIWNGSFAWLYPSVAVNGVSALGGTISYGGGTIATPYPNYAIWVIDNVSPGLPLGTNFLVAAGNSGANRWGDYFSTKPHRQYPNTWVCAGFFKNGTTVVPRYLWFGRERDVIQSPTTRGKSFDFDGDLKTDVAIFRPSNGQWWVQRSSNSTVFATTFGATADRIVPADFTGDNKTDIAVFRPSNNNWLVLRSENFTFYGFAYGASGDVPAPGYFDTDNLADVAVFRPSTGTWYIQRSTDGGTTITAFGTNGDVPVVGNYDGDNRDDIAIFRPSNGQWWISRSSSGVVAYQFGSSGDKPVTGDFTGDGKADAAIWRPSNGNWFVLRSENLTFFAAPFGANGDVPLSGDFDGDSLNDFAVFRPSTNVWYVNRTTGGTTTTGFGTSGDKPVPSAFVP